MSNHLLALLAFAAGFGLTVQVGMNAALAAPLGGRVPALLVNFLVGTCAIAAWVAIARIRVPLSALSAAPAWAWFGGVLGAFYVLTTMLVGPRLGATALLALTVAGQLTAALLVDQFGWLGFPVQPISLTRVVGVLMLCAGALLIVR